MSARRLVPALATFLVGLVFLAGSLNLDVELSQRIGGVIGPARYPLILAVCAMVLALLIVLEPPPSGADAIPDAAAVPVSRATAVKIVALFAAILAFLVLFKPLGYAISATGLIMAIMLLGGLRNRLLALALAVGLVALFYVAFEKILLVSLPEMPLLGGPW